MKRLIASAIVLIASTGQLRAGVIINVTESGNDVIVNANGDLNLNDLSLFASGGRVAVLQPDRGILTAGSAPGSTSTDRYLIPVGPTSFGAGGAVLPDSGTGDRVGIFGDASGSSGTSSLLYVPSGYASGAALSGSSVYQSQSFTSLGLLEGSYAYSWGSGANADSMTINIGSTAVPEPTSLAIFGLGGLGLVAGGIRRRKQQQA